MFSVLCGFDAVPSPLKKAAENFSHTRFVVDD
jgi:hypothetical protein